MLNYQETLLCLGLDQVKFSPQFFFQNLIGIFITKQGRFEAEFIEQRVKGLCDFMKSAVNHPWARGEPGLQKFLENQDFDCKK